MSFLTPFYVLGLLAIAAPIVFHLIRRTPKGEVPFSSLMFLTATPPRLTRRSRLDNILLLLLRAAALALLALAFARPFLREAAILSFGESERRRVAILVDVSASMRRGDLAKQARDLAARTITECRPGDQLAVLAFDSSTRTLMSFAESSTLDPARRQAVALAGLDQLQPTYGSTNLGQALVDAIGAIEDAADASEKAGRMPRRIVLVSDLQQGSRLEALGDFEWPSDVELDLKTVTAGALNAGPQWLPLTELEAGSTSTSSEPDPSLRVRVGNDAGSRLEAFTLTWLDDRGADVGPPTPAYVPPGESRVVKVPPPPPARSRVLQLRGDAQAFDNTLFYADLPKGEASVLHLGLDALDDPNALLYYLQRVFEDSPGRTVRVTSKRPGEPVDLEADRSLRLVVLDAETSVDNAAKLRKFARGGGTVLVVLTAAGPSPTLANLAESAPITLEDSRPGRDAMLAEIAFDHPLFASMASAQFNDFTRIRFWKHRRIDEHAIAEGRVLARFEGGDPAIVEKSVGSGRLVVFASGWAPGDSQLARSSKFVPLMASILEGREPPPADASSYKVGDRVPIVLDRGPISIRKPDGSTVVTKTGASGFAGTDRPGVYQVSTSGESRAFAVNLDPLESRTVPLAVETLEQLGCKLSKPSREVVDRDHLRQMQNAELEGRQKLWRALVLAAIGILIVETWLAGRHGRPRSEPLAT